MLFTEQYKLICMTTSIRNMLIYELFWLWILFLKDLMGIVAFYLFMD